MNKVDFNGRVVIVTGAGRGIGRSYALALARRGAKVVVNDIGASDVPGLTSAQAVAREITDGGGRALAVAEDVVSASGGQAITDAAVEAFGTVDAVINNAGILRRGMFDTIPANEIADVLNVHLLGTFNVTQAAWKVMMAKGYGRVVCTSSSATFGMEGNACYSAAKAGMIGMVKALAMEGEGHDIKVNGLIPFAISPMAKESPATAIPARDAAANVAVQNALADRSPPETVAALTLYLASESCGVSGDVLSAIGGRFARLALMVGEGWVQPDIAALTPEDIGDNLDAVTTLRGAREMTRMTDDFQFALDCINRA